MVFSSSDDDAHAYLYVCPKCFELYEEGGPCQPLPYDGDGDAVLALRRWSSRRAVRYALKR